jgi:5-aminolevulinate synthase
MHEDVGIREWARRSGSAFNQTTRVHFANAIQRLTDKRRYLVFIDLDRDATRVPTAVWRPNGSQEQRSVTICAQTTLGMGFTLRFAGAAVAAVSATGFGHP